MTITEAPAKHSDQDAFWAKISDESFEFRTVRMPDRKVTGAQVAEAAGAHPVEDFVILLQLKTFELETLRPNEQLDLTKAARFFVINGDGTDRFTVDGLSLEWPIKVLTGLDIKRLVGKEDDEVELVLEREDEPDKIIDDEDEVRISGRGAEKFKTRPAKVHVKIIVNAREREWTKKKISFEELVKIAFPAPPTGQYIVYTITYHSGSRHHPEGTLTEGESVRVKNGMVFNVRFTDKS